MAANKENIMNLLGGSSHDIDNKQKNINNLNIDNDKEIRATFIVKESYVQALKDIAWYDRKKIKEVIDEAIYEYIKNNNEKILDIDRKKK